jgi:hypothetical protein
MEILSIALKLNPLLKYLISQNLLNVKENTASKDETGTDFSMLFHSNKPMIEGSISGQCCSDQIYITCLLLSPGISQNILHGMKIFKEAMAITRSK